MHALTAHNWQKRINFWLIAFINSHLLLVIVTIDTSALNCSAAAAAIIMFEARSNISKRKRQTKHVVNVKRNMRTNIFTFMNGKYKRKKNPQTPRMSTNVQQNNEKEAYARDMSGK